MIAGQQTAAAVLHELARAGFVRRETGSTPADARWVVTGPAGRDGWLLGERRWWAVDVAGMCPLYQELYERIFAERLRCWDATGGGDVGVLRSGGLIVYWGPDAVMTARSPSTVALRHVEAGDLKWVTWLERWWQESAVAFEESLDHFWTELCRGQVSITGLEAILDAKVSLNAIGVDALVPDQRRVAPWLAPHVAPDLLPEVLMATFTPASGYVAYDVREAECWRLAAAALSDGSLPVAAHARFVQRGLFYAYGTLDTDRTAFYLHRYPFEIAAHYGAAAGASGEPAACLAEVRQRPWRRRLHRLWARQLIEAIPNPTARGRLLALHRLTGTARDYDEEKRRLNMKLWRGLVALAHSADISLVWGDLDRLRTVIAARNGCITIDPLFTTGIAGTPDATAEPM